MSFKGLNLSSKMIDSLNRQKYFNPSPIQNRAIPKALKGETLMVQSSTGSGKTLCYLIPIIENIDYKEVIDFALSQLTVQLQSLLVIIRGEVGRFQSGTAELIGHIVGVFFCGAEA